MLVLHEKLPQGLFAALSILSQKVRLNNLVYVFYCQTLAKHFQGHKNLEKHNVTNFILQDHIS